MNETLACIDIGLKRIGVALCVHENIVTPQVAILRKNRNQAAYEVDEFLKQWNITTLIVGFPSASVDMQNRIKHFVNLLEFQGKIIFQEENMSSIEAKSLMQGEIKQKRDGRIDSIAAQIILQRYLQKAKA